MADVKFIPSIKHRIKGLDELRGIAISSVLIGHIAWLFPEHGVYNFISRLGLGAVGVNLFFIISGYLIATILIKSKGDDNYFTKFYIRRAFRILPLAYLMIFLGFIATYLANRPFDNPFDSLLYYLTFTQNFIPSPPEGTLRVGSNYILPLIGLSPMWSLAVEEQFYLILPFLIKFVKEKFFPYLIFIISIFSVFLSLQFPPEVEFVYTNFKQTWFRLFYFGIGFYLTSTRYNFYLVALFLCWGLLQAIYAFNGVVFGVLELPIAIVFTVVVYVSINKQLYIKNKVMSEFGKLCFGIYLFHYPITSGLRHANLKLDTIEKLIVVVAYIAVSYILAKLSYTYFEIPIQNQRHKFENLKFKFGNILKLVRGN